MSCKLICDKCNQEIDLEKVFLDDTKYGMVGISEFQAESLSPEYDFIGGKWLSEK